MSLEQFIATKKITKHKREGYIVKRASLYSEDSELLHALTSHGPSTSCIFDAPTNLRKKRSFRERYISNWYQSFWPPFFLSSYLWAAFHCPTLLLGAKDPCRCRSAQIRNQPLTTGLGLTATKWRSLRTDHIRICFFLSFLLRKARLQFVCRWVSSFESALRVSTPRALRVSTSERDSEQPVRRLYVDVSPYGDCKCYTTILDAASCTSLRSSYLFHSMCLS